MGRRRKADPKRNQLCLRLTDRQLELLQRYADFRDFDSEVDALRKMVDGLEDWLARQEAKGIAGSPPPPVATSHSGLPDRSDVSTEAPGEPSVGDFAGRPSVGLPDAHWNDGTGD